MPITWSFTIASAIALALHLRKLRHHYLNRVAVVRSGQNGELLLTARLLLQQSVVRTGINVFLLAAGAGFLVGFRPLGFALALIPVLTASATFFDPA